jgi:uncharacterized protein (DUF488 family)
MSDNIFTIGHSTQPVEQFVGKLRDHGITAIADVRSTPFSRHNPQFNKDELSATLKRYGIRYVFLGKELGARTQDECCYVDDKVRYALLAQTDLFKSGIARVLEGTRTYKIALMCAEKDPIECHRAILVARELVQAGCNVQHILANGTLESQESTLSRLVIQLQREQPEDLFRPGGVSLDEAYETQGQRIAYDRSAQRK